MAVDLEPGDLEVLVGLVALDWVLVGLVALDLVLVDLVALDWVSVAPVRLQHRTCNHPPLFGT